jgi:hypothetical protein
VDPSFGIGTGAKHRFDNQTIPATGVGAINHSRVSFGFTVTRLFGNLGGARIQTGSVKMSFRFIHPAIVLVLLSTGAWAAPASTCVVTSPRYQLTSDNVDWSVKTRSGQTCIRGLRYGSVVLETVKLIARPQSGNVKLVGPGFSYTAKGDFVGEDSFTIEVSGTTNKIHGTSTIHVLVTVDNASP